MCKGKGTSIVEKLVCAIHILSHFKNYLALEALGREHGNWAMELDFNPDLLDSKTNGNFYYCERLYHSRNHSTSHFCLPAAGVTYEDIKKCFGGSLGLSYTYSESITIGGGLSQEDCKKVGGGDSSKYLVKSFLKSKARLFFEHTIRARVPKSPLGSTRE